MKLKRIGKTSAQEIEKANGDTLLISYSTVVAGQIDGKFVRTKEHYSVTTSKQINKWLEGRNAEVVEQSYLDQQL